MSSKRDDPRVGALVSFTTQTEIFLADILRDARDRDFCPACALSYVAQLLLAACEVAEHDPDAATDELPPTAFDDSPGHA